jgi:hypothetical protein
MRTITFTSCFYAGTNHKHVQLALNQGETNLKAAQIAAMKAYSLGQVEMLDKQSVPDAGLIRCILVALGAKCPGAKLNLNLLKNARSSIPVHAEALEAVASLGIALTGLTLGSNTLESGDFSTLLSGLSACTPSLGNFWFVNSRAARREVESRILTRESCSLLQSALGSANALRHLKLDFGRLWRSRNIQTLTSELLVTSAHPMLQSLSLNFLLVTERTLLKALADWGGQLEKVTFRVVYLADIAGEGWSDVLKMLATMPNLHKTRLFWLYSRHGFVDLRNLKHGEIKTFCGGDRGLLSDVVFRGDEVVAGLHELLQRGLGYY